METKSRERGQALILIVFAILGLVGITGLVVDGGMAYSDRRHAQNAADSAAMAAALGHVRGRDINTTALAVAATDGFNDDKAQNWVTVSVADSPSGTCPNMTVGLDITVQISSISNAYFAPVLGIRQLRNTVSATSRSCAPYLGPLFNGDAIVALTPSGIGFDATGNPSWLVSGGGIFSNSSSSPSARCKGAAGVSAPSLTSVGGVELKCSGTIGQTTTGVTQYTYADYSSMLPRVPKCDGTAKHVGGFWVVQAGADGSKVAFSGDMTFGAGLFCVTNSPGPYHGQITGSNVTFYLQPAGFNIKFNGGGNLTATAPTALSCGGCEYAGVLMFSAAQLSGSDLLNTQSIDLRGNGTGILAGSVIVPSASVTMFGNSSGTGNQTQVIAYNVNSGGTTDLKINYDAKGGFQAQQPAWITLLR